MVTKVATRGQHTTHTTRLSSGNKFWVHANYVCTGTIVSIVILLSLQNALKKSRPRVHQSVMTQCTTCDSDSNEVYKCHELSLVNENILLLENYHIRTVQIIISYVIVGPLRPCKNSH